MVRKRDAYTRWRAKRSRPKTPAPKNGLVIAELARVSGVSLRTLRYYVQLKLLRPLELRGTATRYPRRELLRLLGILRMKSETRASLAEIRRKLDTLAEKELEAWLLAGPLPADAAAALGITGRGTAGSPRFDAAAGTFDVNASWPGAAVPTASGCSEPGASEPGASAPIARYERGTVETWQRVCLLPGLELLVRCDASPAVRRAAQSIYDDYVGR
ncbi:MAG: MerR family transcriptional regulator [Polyangiaceae bacterium]|nr:MerR family transcriptional regulator [Polyangiaceae bacterium]